ncbi:MAG: hypothetical protein ACYC27_15795 [Armatimonadota bacterium]
MKRLWMLAMVLLFATGVIAQTPAPEVKDTRLDKKISLTFNHTKLEDVLAAMTKSTGIEFTAGSGERDWRVRERKVTIHASDIYAGVLMDEISKLLGYRVTRGGKTGEWSYLFWQDKKAKDLEAEMVAASKVAAAERAMKLRQSAVDTVEAALSMSPEDALKMKESDPWLAYMGGTKSGRGFAQLMSSLNQFSPVDRDLMLRGRRVNLSLSGATGSLSQAISDSTSGGLFGAIRKMAPGQLDALQPSELTFLPMGEMGGDMASMAGFGGMAVITGTMPGLPDMSGMSPFGNGIPMAIFPITDSNSLVAKAFGDMYFALDEGASLQDAITKMQTNAMNPDFLAESLANESPTEKNPPTDPELTREVEIADVRSEITASPNNPEKMKESQGKAIEEIARAFGMPVMLETFNSSLPIALFLKPGKQPLYKVLISLEKSGYKWEKGEGDFRIRPIDWALQRSYEIQESLMQKFKDTLAKQGEFTLEDIGYIAYMLTDDQIQNNLIADPDLTYALVSMVNPMGSSRDMLRVYGSLNNQQRVAIKSDKGLPFGQLSNVQWDRLNSVITDKVGGVYINDGTIRLIPQQIDTKDAPQGMQMGGMQMAIFEMNIQVDNEAKPRVVRDMIMLYGKEQIAMMKGMQKAAQDAADKANQQKQGSKAAPVPAPAK